MSSSVSEFSEPRRAAWASLRPASSLGRNFRAHCRIKATFPTGPKNELRWHDGFVFDHNQLEREEGEDIEYQYTLFFPIDATDEVVSAPFNGKDICFRKQHLPDPKAGVSAR